MEKKIGEFGPIYKQFKGKGREAIKHLLKVKKGECISALHREDIGYIDIIWGENDPKTNKGFGLKHIVEKHGKEIKELGFDVWDFIPIVVQYASICKSSSKKGRVIYEGNMFRFVLIVNEKKRWLLTLFDLRKKPKKKS